MPPHSAKIEGADAPAWDCHAHVFGPYDRFPLAPTRNQTPPEANEAMYLAMLARIGCGRGVLVQTSAHGGDHSQLEYMLEAHPQLRGVMVPTPDTGRQTLSAMRARGVRAARFSHRPGLDFPGAPGIDDLERLAPMLADAGLHAELWTLSGALATIAPCLARLPVPVAIDHMGGFDPDAGIDAPGFRALLDLLEKGRAWVKLCAYRNLQNHGDWACGRVFHDALLQANPDQLVWGSDWPHLRVQPVPDAADLLARFRAWTPDASLATRILVDNPARLYDRGDHGD